MNHVSIQSSSAFIESNKKGHEFYTSDKLFFRKKIQKNLEKVSLRFKSFNFKLISKIKLEFGKIRASNQN